MPQPTELKRVPIWLDCDPGHDDAFAMLMCAHHPSIDFLGVSTVHGNASLAKTTNNASSLLIAFGRTDVPIYPGASKPFCRPAVHAPDIHGTSGLDGTDLLPKPDEIEASHQALTAIAAMYAALMKHPAGTAWVVATGTLTNVALLLAVYPDVAKHLAGVSIMGGAFKDTLSSAALGKLADGKARPQRIGNITPWAEFNIYCDPESAQAIVSHSELSGKIIIIPLDITHTVLATKQILDRVLHDEKGQVSPLRQMMHDLLVFFAHTYSEVFGLIAGPPLHDPVAVAAVLHREGIEQNLRFLPVDHVLSSITVGVVTSGKHGDSSELGRTVAVKDAEGKHVYVPRELNVGKFWQCLIQCLDRAEQVSRMGHALSQKT